MNGADENPSAPNNGAEEDDLELKPWVKPAAYIGVGGLLILGMGFWTFHLGHSQGYAEGVASGKVAEAVNAKAVENLTRFMQAAAADDATLESMAADTNASLAWIKDGRIRLEAEWLLAETLLERGMTEPAVRLLAKIFPNVPQQPLWVSRAMQAAESLAAAHDRGAARAYFRYAADTYAALGDNAGRVSALGNILAIEMAESGSSEETAAGLDALMEELAPLGDSAVPYLAAIQVGMGQRCREKGAMQEADAHFSAVLNSVKEKTATPAAKVCLGVAAMEKGETDRAEKLLTDGLASLGHELQNVPCRILALRSLATIAQNRPHGTGRALSYLNQAAGEAEFNLSADNTFWPLLYDQRGWLYLVCEEDEAAAREDFARALSLTKEPAFRIQPLEGAARCAVLRSDAKAATALLDECLILRRSYAAADKASEGRVLLQLAQAKNLNGYSAAVAAAYAQAAACLEALPDADSRDNLMTALWGQASCCMEIKQWAEAAAVWRRLKGMVADKPDRAEYVRKRLHECEGLIRLKDTPVPDDKDDIEA